MQKMNKIFVIAAIAVAIVLGSLYVVTEIIITEDRVSAQASVDLTIDSFDGNLDSVVLTQGKYYSFVLDEKLEQILLHPREELVDTPPVGLASANISINEMNHMLDKSGAVWVHYEFYNPETGNIDPKTTYLVKHAGYVFGAGFYSP